MAVEPLQPFLARGGVKSTINLSSPAHFGSLVLVQHKAMLQGRHRLSDQVSPRELIQRKLYIYRRSEKDS